MRTIQEWARRARRRDFVVQSIVAAGSTALAAVRPATLTTWGRVWFRAVLATLTGVSMHSSLSREPLGGARERLGMTAGTVGATLALAEAIEALDERWHRGLQKRGVQRPRLVIMAVSLVFGVIGLVIQAITDRREARNDSGDEDAEADEADLPEPLRELTAVILDATDDFGAAELREQLVTARAQFYYGRNPDFWPSIGLIADPELPRAVPGDGHFPVIGRFRALEGVTFDLYLMIRDGKLDVLSFDTGDDWTEEATQNWIETDRNADEVGRWPRPDELTLLIETPRGYAELPR